MDPFHVEVHIDSGWEFVNLFYDRKARTFYCRMRKVEFEKNQNDWREVTGNGATAQTALDNAMSERDTS